jgi:hypothetical protein
MSPVRNVTWAGSAGREKINFGIVLLFDEASMGSFVSRRLMLSTMLMSSICETKLLRPGVALDRRDMLTMRLLWKRRRFTMVSILYLAQLSNAHTRT